MIRIDLTIAIAVYLTIHLLLVFICWISYTLKEDTAIATNKNLIHQCPFCTSIFVSYNDSEVKVCPKCDSYISSEKGIEQGANKHV